MGNNFLYFALSGFQSLSVDWNGTRCQLSNWGEQALSPLPSSSSFDWSRLQAFWWQRFDRKFILRCAFSMKFFCKQTSRHKNFQRKKSLLFVAQGNTFNHRRARCILRTRHKNQIRLSQFNNVSPFAQSWNTSQVALWSLSPLLYHTFKKAFISDRKTALTRVWQKSSKLASNMIIQKRVISHKIYN